MRVWVGVSSLTGGVALAPVLDDDDELAPVLLLLLFDTLPVLDDAAPLLELSGTPVLDDTPVLLLLLETVEEEDTPVLEEEEDTTVKLDQHVWYTRSISPITFVPLTAA